MSHEAVEKNAGLLILFIIIVISFGGLVEIVPLFFMKDTTQPVAGLKPYSPLRLEGRWHRVHLINPRDVVPESNMPGFPWLAENTLDGKLTAKKMRVMNTLIAATCNGCELYTEEQIAKAADEVRGKTELDALIAYLQGLGTALKGK